MMKPLLLSGINAISLAIIVVAVLLILRPRGQAKNKCVFAAPGLHYIGDDDVGLT